MACCGQRCLSVKGTSGARSASYSLARRFWSQFFCMLVSFNASRFCVLETHGIPHAIDAKDIHAVGYHKTITRRSAPHPSPRTAASAAAFLRCLARRSRRLSTRAASIDEFKGDGEATSRALAPAPAGAVPPWHTVETRKVDNSSGVMVDGASISTSSTWRQAKTLRTRSCRFMSGESMAPLFYTFIPMDAHQQVVATCSTGLEEL